MKYEYFVDRAKSWLTGVSGTTLANKYHKDLAQLMYDCYRQGTIDAKLEIKNALGIND